MDSDFQSKLKSVLSDPDALAKITAIASSLGMDDQKSQPVAEEPKIQPTETANSLPAIVQNLSPAENDPRLQLLTSLKPLLREEKRAKIDSLTRALAVASMMKNIRK